MAVCKMEIILMDVTSHLFAEQLTRTFEVLFTGVEECVLTIDYYLLSDIRTW